jgi:hypothetical protein
MSRYVLSVDPGKATGVALLKLEDGEEPFIVYSGEAQPFEFAEIVRLLFSSFDGEFHNLEIVCEKFTINAQTVRNSQAPFSLEQIGVLKQIMQDFDMDRESIVWQMPVDAKRMFPNEALKTLKVWHRGGEGHANDALRHALLRLVKKGWIPRKLLE